MTEADGGGPDAHRDDHDDHDDHRDDHDDHDDHDRSGDGRHDDGADHHGSPGLKDDATIADEPSVHDGIGATPRLTWSSVTDTGGSARPATGSSPDRDAPGGSADRSSFRFDLGGALARIGGDEPDDARPIDRAEPSEPGRSDPDPSESSRSESSRSEPAATDGRSSDSTAASGSGTHIAPPLIDLGRLGLDDTPTGSASAAPAVTDTGQTGQTAGTPTTPIADLAATRATFDRYVSRTSEPDPAPDLGSAGSRAPVDRSVTRDADVDPTPSEPDYPRRIPGAHLDPRHRLDDDFTAGDPPSVVPQRAERPADTVPEIREATPADLPPRRTTPPASSVFGDVDPYDPSVRGRSGVPGAPSLPGVPSSMPTLPASNPAAPPPIADNPAADIGVTPDMTALRSAQLKASRQQRQGKLFGRSLMAFVVVGGLIAAAMVFGRSLLFDTDWDARLTPIVNEVEADRGAPFTSTVPLSTLGPTEFGERFQSVRFGSDWVERVPEWRALNLAVGDVTAESVAAELALERRAFYDPAIGEIIVVEGSDGNRDDLRIALETAYDAQLGVDEADDRLDAGFAGLSTPETIGRRAVDRYLVNRAAERRPANQTLPIPIAYEQAAIDTLGEPLLAAADIDVTTLTPSSPTPADIGEPLDDAPASTASGLPLPGDQPRGDAVALGTDDWSLVWGTRLPETTVERLVEQVVADSYRVVDRSGVVCVIAVFQTVDADAGSALFTSMLTWAAAAPAASQSVATQLGPERVQIEACDPGVGSSVAGNPGVVDALVARQQRRLTN